MSISSNFDTMWLNIWGNTLLGALALMALFFYLCFRRKYGIVETMYVVYPVLMGLTMSEYLPRWMQGLFIMGIGMLWGLAVTKVFNSLESWNKIYTVFLCANLALTLVGFSVTHTYTNTGEAMDMQGTSSRSVSGVSVGNFIQSATALLAVVQPVFDFLLGGGIAGMLLSAGFPEEVRILVGIPMAFLGLLATVSLLGFLWPIFRTLLEFTSGIFGAAIRVFR